MAENDRAASAADAIGVRRRKFREEVQVAFPQLRLIQDATLRAQTEEAFVYALVKSSWDSLRDVPTLFITKEPTGNLVEHTGIVTSISVHATELMLGAGLHLDKDTVISAALLHDVGKILEFGVAEGKTVINELIRHSFSGAHVAMSVGLPDRVVHAISLHAWEGELELPPGHTIMGTRLINARGKEGMIVAYADLMAAKLFRREYAEGNGTAPSLLPGVPFNS